MPDQNSASVTTSSLQFMQMAWKKGVSSKSAPTQIARFISATDKGKKSSAFNSKRKSQLNWLRGRNPGLAVDIVDRGQHTLRAILGEQS
jgi:hypothetical protein